MLAADLEVVRADHNARRLHAASAMSPPTSNTSAAPTRSRQARRDGLARAQRLAYHRNTNPETRS